VVFKFEEQVIIGTFHNRNIAMTRPLIFTVGVLTHAAGFVMTVVVRTAYPVR
jgi:hypothetical protein